MMEQNEFKFCVNCGTRLGKQVRFCTNCGTPCRDEGAFASPAPKAAPEKSPVPEPTPKTETGGAASPVQEVAPPDEALTQRIPHHFPEQPPKNTPEPIPKYAREPAPSQNQSNAAFGKISTGEETDFIIPNSPRPQTQWQPQPQPQPQWQPQPQPQPQPQTYAKPKRAPAPKETAGQKSGHIVLNVFLSILTAIFLLAGMTLLSVHSLLEEDNVEDLIEKIDIYELVDSYFEENEDVSLEERFTDLIQFGTQYTIKTKTIRTILNGERVRDFLADVINDYIEAFREEKDAEPISKNKIKSLFDKTVETLRGDLGSYAQWDDNYINGELDKIEFSSFSTFALSEEMPSAIHILTVVLKYDLLFGIFCLAIAALLATLMIILDRRELGRSFVFAGAATALSGILFATAALILKLGAFTVDAVSKTAFKNAVRCLRLPSGGHIAVIFIGLALLAAGIAISAIRKKKEE